jgi:hypothetical protein
MLIAALTSRGEVCGISMTVDAPPGSTPASGGGSETGTAVRFFMRIFATVASD